MPKPNNPNQAAHTLFGRRGKLSIAAAGLLVLGGAAGAVIAAESRPTVSMLPAQPVAIHSLSSSGIYTIRGRVTEIYGNKIILADPSGRALVDLGREGDDRSLVTTGEAVTVQGLFDRGLVHAAFLIGPDNKVVALGPLAGPPHGPGGPHDRHRPEDGPDSPPPPPVDGAPAARPAAN